LSDRPLYHQSRARRPHEEIPKKFEEMKDFSPGWPSTRLGLYLKRAAQYAAADDLNRDLMGGPT
jgi:hypothetical protein